MPPITPEQIAMAGQIAQPFIDIFTYERNKRGAKELAKYNQELALDMWNRTNYHAQTQQMKKAGLNIGLMYKGTGEGGSTQGAGRAETPMMQSPQIGGMAMLPLQAEQIKANIESTKAQAKLANTQANQLKGEGEGKGKAEILNIKALTENAKVQGEILKYEKEKADIETTIAKLTFDEAVRQMEEISKKLIAEARIALTEAKTAEATQQETIKQIQLKTEIDKTALKAQKLGLTKTEADIQAVNVGIMKVTEEIASILTERTQSWEKLSLAQRETMVKEAMLKLQKEVVDFETSTPERIKQWTSIIGDLIPLAPGRKPAPIGFK